MESLRRKILRLYPFPQQVIKMGFAHAEYRKDVKMKTYPTGFRSKGRHAQAMPGRVLLHLAVFLTLLLIAPFQAAAQNVIIRGGYFFDAVGEDAQKNDVMVIISGRFFCLGEMPDGIDTEKFKTVNLTDNDYVLPGIFDMHAYYRVTFDRKRYDETEVNPVLFLANGVTSTFPAGEINPDRMRELRLRP